MLSGAYYNEFDPFAAQWLRNLIAAGHIADGVVDERSIIDVHPDDLRGFTQCHFFAGIGGWSLALRMAGWPDDRLVWTGSPPCQPFSPAGKQEGIKDDRHLAPVWLNLVKERHPPVLFGEQVAAAVTKDNWLDDLQNELEAEDYATGKIVLPACSVGAPHIRQRIWIVAERVGHPGESFQSRLAGDGGSEVGREEQDRPIAEASIYGGLANTDGQQPNRSRTRREVKSTDIGGALGLANSIDNRQQSSSGNCSGGQPPSERDDPRGCCSISGLAKSERDGSHRASGDETEQSGNRQKNRISIGSSEGLRGADRPHPLNVRWDDADWLFCKDGKWRPVEPGSFPLVNGFPNRVGVLRGFGNAIVPEVAAEMIGAYLDA